MNHVKTFEQYNTPEGEMVSESMFEDFKTKVKKFLDNPTDVTIANKLLQKAFVVQFNAKVTKPLEKLVLDLSLEEKINLLKGVLERLEYSRPEALRLVKSKTSDKLKVGTLTRKKAEEQEYY